MGRGKLIFKGEDGDTNKNKAKKKKKKSKHSLKGDESASNISSIRQEEPVSVSSSPAAASRVTRETKDVTSNNTTPKIHQGTGTITASGTVVTGHETRFTRQVNVGDALLVTIIDGQQQPQQEMRVITMRLSDTSLNLSSSFSKNLAQPTSFQYIPKPREKAKEARLKQQKALQNAQEEEQQAFGTYGTTEELVYREKTEHGSYRIKRVKVDDGKGAVSRGDLLEMRSKKKSDKYC